MPPMRKNWWYFRLALLAFAATALGFYLFHSTPWRRALGLQPSYQQQIAEGDRILAALYAFQYDTDLWPQYLDDLHLPPLQYRWFYEVQPLEGGHRQPALSTDAPAEGSRAHLAFAFGPDRANGDWHLFSATADRVERAGTHLPTSRAPLTRSVRGISHFPATLAELDRRITREPGRIEHYQDKASLLVLSQKLPDARAVIAAAAARFPDSAWPRLAAAALDLDETPTPASIDSFAAFASAHPTFSRFYQLSWLYRQTGEDTQTRIAMARTLQLPIEVDPDDTHIAAFYLYDMTRWSLQTTRWNLAVDLCNAWQQAAGASTVKDQSFWALRAAAQLALSHFPAAQADLEKSRHAEPSWILAAPNLQTLADAITQKKPSFRLTFPPAPAEFQVFIRPE